MTDRSIAALAPAEKPYSRRVAEGLAVWVHPSGRRVWRFRARVGGRLESVTLGRWPHLAHKDALAKAARLRGAADAGTSLQETIRPRRCAGGQPTVRSFGERWLKDVVHRARKDPQPVRRMLERDVYPELGGRRVAHVSQAEVQRLIFAKRDAGSPQAAAALRHLLRRFFDYARVCGLIAANPTDGTPRKYVAARVARSRSLSEAELRVFFRRLAHLGPKMAAVLELLLLTLARKGELLRARWDHVDLERGVWEVPPELSKTGAPHIVYLAPRAVELFRLLRTLAGRAQAVLPMRDALTEPMEPSGVNKAVRRHRWGIADFTPHDLRRTASTLLNEMGYSPDWIEKALNHRSKGVRGVYNRAEYAEQRRRMLEEWAAWLAVLREG